MNAPAKGNRGHVLVSKVGLDGHDRGAKVLARMLREEGFEVDYLGVRTTAEQLAQCARSRAVDVVAVSLLSGAHVEVAALVRGALDAAGLPHVPIAIGGLIPAGDIPALRASGVASVFTPGQADAGPQAISAAMDDLVSQARAAVQEG